MANNPSLTLSGPPLRRRALLDLDQFLALALRSIPSSGTASYADSRSR